MLRGSRPGLSPRRWGFCPAARGTARGEAAPVVGSTRSFKANILDSQAIYRPRRRSRDSVAIRPSLATNGMAAAGDVVRGGSEDASDLIDIMFIINPKGGNGKALREWNRLRPMVQQELGLAFRVQEVFTSGPGDAARIAKQAAECGTNTVVACGGDGTIGEVVNGLMEAREQIQGDQDGKLMPTKLGVLPLGTGSDYIRSFGWNRDPAAALARLKGGRTMLISVGRVSCTPERAQALGQATSAEGATRVRYFANISSCGVSGQTARAAGWLKSLGSFLAYNLGAVFGFWKHRRQRCRYRLDGGQWQWAQALTISACACGQYFGGGMRIAKEASPDSDQMSLVLIDGYSLFAFLARNSTFRRGNLEGLPRVAVARAATVELEQERCSNPEVLIEADGEVVGCLPASWQLLPHSLELLV